MQGESLVVSRGDDEHVQMRPGIAEIQGVHNHTNVAEWLFPAGEYQTVQWPPRGESSFPGKVGPVTIGPLKRIRPFSRSLLRSKSMSNF